MAVHKSLISKLLVGAGILTTLSCWGVRAPTTATELKENEYDGNYAAVRSCNGLMDRRFTVKISNNRFEVEHRNSEMYEKFQGNLTPGTSNKASVSGQYKLESGRSGKIHYEGTLSQPWQIYLWGLDDSRGCSLTLQKVMASEKKKNLKRTWEGSFQSKTRIAERRSCQSLDLEVGWRSNEVGKGRLKILISKYNRTVVLIIT